MLWRLDPQANRYDAAGKYEGRGVWTIVRVNKVGRLSVEIGSDIYSAKYDRKTGEMRDRRGYSGLPALYGSVERASAWWRDNRQTFADAVRSCRDENILKTIAFALGLNGPPDFAAIPGDSDPTPAGRLALQEPDADV